MSGTAISHTTAILPGKSKRHYFGLAGLILQFAGLATNIVFFVIGRFNLIPNVHLPIPQSIASYTLKAVLVSIIPGLLGLIWDRDRTLTFLDLALVFVSLTVMGVLAGHW
jgi:hypothetical protein